MHHRLQGVEPKSAVAAASLFLAGKADEQPRRVRDVLNAVAPAGGVRDLDEMYHDAKADLVDAEQAALRELCFDASMETPLALALALAHALTLRPATAQLALCLANDALFSAACRAARPVAVAARPSTSRARGRGDPGAGAVSTGWARRFGAADADVAAARGVISRDRGPRSGAKGGRIVCVRSVRPTYIVRRGGRRANAQSVGLLLHSLSDGSPLTARSSAPPRGGGKVRAGDAEREERHRGRDDDARN